MQEGFVVVLCCVSLTDWAKFDEIPMEVAPVVAPSPWASSGKDAESTTTGGGGGGGGWAKFETGGVAEVRDNEKDSSTSGWANFSPMNWTEQEDANTVPRYLLRMLETIAHDLLFFPGLPHTFDIQLAQI